MDALTLFADVALHLWWLPAIILCVAFGGWVWR